MTAYMNGADGVKTFWLTMGGVFEMTVNHVVLGLHVGNYLKIIHWRSPWQKVGKDWDLNRLNNSPNEWWCMRKIAHLPFELRQVVLQNFIKRWKGSSCRPYPSIREDILTAMEQNERVAQVGFLMLHFALTYILVYDSFKGFISLVLY